MKRNVKLALLLTLILSLAVGLPAAYAVEGQAVALGTRARLADGGQAVDIRVTVNCPAGRDVLEAFVYLVQNEYTSTFGYFGLVCDGRARPYTVRVYAYEDSPLFTYGAATATAYILLHNMDTGATESAGATQDVTIR